MPALLKSLGYRLEWAILIVLFTIMRLLSIEKASAIMGTVGRAIGPHIRVTRTAHENLRFAFPEWTEAKRQKIIGDMWENLGRYIGELPHIARMTAQEFQSIAEIHGEEHLQTAAATGKGSLFFSCHMANWELGAKASWSLGVPFHIVYRPLNNPLVNKMTNDFRNCYQAGGIAKSAAGSRELLARLKEGRPIAMLIDHKMRSGIPLQFFGRDAMTSTSIADLAVKYGYPIIPTRVERLGHTARFRISFEPPMEFERSGNAREDAVALMRQTHEKMESWISERPEQWFWVHRRWEMKKNR